MTDSWVGTSAATSVSRAVLLLALRVVLLFAAVAVAYLLLSALRGPAAYATDTIAVGGVLPGSAVGGTTGAVRARPVVVSTMDTTTPSSGAAKSATGGTTPRTGPGTGAGSSRSVASVSCPVPSGSGRAPAVPAKPAAPDNSGQQDRQTAQGLAAPRRAVHERAARERGGQGHAGQDHTAQGRGGDEASAGRGGDKAAGGETDSGESGSGRSAPARPTVPDAAESGDGDEQSSNDEDSDSDQGEDSDQGNDATARNGRPATPPGQQAGGHAAPHDTGADHAGSDVPPGSTMAGPVVVGGGAQVSPHDAHQNRPVRGAPARSTAASGTDAVTDPGMTGDGSEPPVPGVPVPVQSTMVEGLSSGQTHPGASLAAGIPNRFPAVPDTYPLHVDLPGDLTRPGRVPGVMPVPG